MSENNTCATCVFYKKGQLAEKARCHRYPPVHTMFPMPNQLGQMAMREMTAFPVVEPNWSCGEHKPIEKNPKRHIGSPEELTAEEDAKLLDDMKKVVGKKPSSLSDFLLKDS